MGGRVHPEDQVIQVKEVCPDPMESLANKGLKDFKDCLGLPGHLAIKD